MKILGKIGCLIWFGVLSSGDLAFGFEHTKTLPKGIRSVTMRTVHTELNEKTDAKGLREPIAKPLQKNLKFSDAMKKDSEAQKNRNRAYLQKEGFSEDDPLGQMNADLAGQVTVLAPIVSYGISDRLTLALAVPIYRASMDAQLGFQPSAEAQEFLDSLAAPHSNKTATALTQGRKLNNAVGEFNAKLREHGFQPLNYWSNTGLGDMTLAGKYRFYETQRLKVATTSGLVLPTGRTDDPDVLNDIPFGDGTWDVFAGVAFDQPLGLGFFLNQNLKYSYQVESSRAMRLATIDESIEVNKERVDYKLGDKVDAGLSLQWESQGGIGGGVGYTAFRKLGDDYRVTSDEVKEKLELGSDQFSTHGEVKLGYSGIDAYRSGKIPVPFTTSLEFKKQLTSKNLPVSDLLTLDVAVYF